MDVRNGGEGGAAATGAEVVHASAGTGAINPDRSVAYRALVPDP